MSELASQQCEACRADAPKVSEQELSELMRLIPDWQPLVVKGELQLRREFTFRNFKEALAFTNRLGELAEAEFHHPAILTEWGKVTVPTRSVDYTATTSSWRHAPTSCSNKRL